jgi:hypothetical protein
MQLSLAGEVLLHNVWEKTAQISIDDEARLAIRFSIQGLQACPFAFLEEFLQSLAKIK